jgi:pimeloyl-ACP methyl ester carboxylesterase
MIWTILWVGVWVIVGLAILVSAAWLAGRWFFIARYPDEVHYATTADGWRIAVTRYRATQPVPGREPILMCHAIGANRMSLDLSDRLSMARHFAAHGWDTWLVELRGRGLSTQPRLFTKYRYDWSFDEYVEQDIPAAVDEVLRATGAERLHYVGFSLGGVVGYGLLGDPARAARVRSAVLIAAPATFSFQRKYLFSWPLRNLRWLRLRFLSRLLAPLAGYMRPTLFGNPQNVPGDNVRRWMVNVTANFARNELLQYGDWIENDQLRSIDHRRDYRKDLARATTPTLLVAGNRDRLAPPPSVKDGYEALGSTDKKLVIASRGTAGFQANYGHYDLAIGEHAPDDIYPLARGWLEEHEVAVVKTAERAADGAAATTN